MVVQVNSSQSKANDMNGLRGCCFSVFDAVIEYLHRGDFALDSVLDVEDCSGCELFKEMLTTDEKDMKCKSSFIIIILDGQAKS